jgi:hypothetical protein
MTYFEDLSDYKFHRDGIRQNTRNVGWLARGHKFDTAEPEERILERITQRANLVDAMSIELWKSPVPLTTNGYLQRAGR